jgi:hypothetical protein
MRERREGRREVRAVQTVERRYSANPPSGEIHGADPPSPAGLQRTHSLISPADSSSPRHLPVALLHTDLGLAGLDLALYSEALESRRRAGGDNGSRGARLNGGGEEVLGDRRRKLAATCQEKPKNRGLEKPRTTKTSSVGRAGTTCGVVRVCGRLLAGCLGLRQ